MMVKIQATISDSLSIRKKSPKIHVPHSSGNNANRLIIKVLEKDICIYIRTGMYILLYTVIKIKDFLDLQSYVCIIMYIIICMLPDFTKATTYVHKGKE